MPLGKFPQRLPVIPLRVNRRTAIRGQMHKEFVSPLISSGWSGLRGFSHFDWF
jgi:hypothetical protein